MNVEAIGSHLVYLGQMVTVADPGVPQAPPAPRTPNLTRELWAPIGQISGSATGLSVHAVMAQCYNINSQINSLLSAKSKLRLLGNSGYNGLRTLSEM